MLQEAVSVRRDFLKIKTGHNGYNLKSGLDDPLHLVCLIFFPFLIFFCVKFTDNKVSLHAQVGVEELNYH